ncbi:MAG: hypothetical protein WBA45_01980 [Microthrixaceae bacterium]
MSDEIELVSDGDGVAVIGEQAAVERWLRSAGLWAASRDLDLARAKRLLAMGSDVVQTASEAAAASARWLRLTEDSAHIVQEYGLMETDTPGISHIMVGVPGEIRSWLQTEDGLGSLITNPAVLSGVANVMAQLASQQSTAEIAAYLARIEIKVDEVLRKQDDNVLAHMIGAGFVIEEAMTVREASGNVNEVTWGKVEGTSETIGHVQSYALLQLSAIAKRFEANTVAGLAKASVHADAEVREWLAVLARSFQLQGLLDVLELDRVEAVSPGELDQHRVGLKAARQNRLALIAEHTEPLLERIDAACGTANARILWSWTKAQAVLKAGNTVAAEIDGLNESLGLPSSAWGWEVRRMDRPAELAAQAIQKTKNAAPAAAGIASAVAMAAIAKERLGGDDTDD